MNDLDCYEGPFASYEGGALFARCCPVCNRFVKADDTVTINGLEVLVEQTNATCSTHGRVEMPFLGFFAEEDFQ